MSNFIPFDQACLPNDQIIVSERYAENLHRALANEISNESGAYEFLRTTYPTETMLRAASLIFERLAKGQAADSPGTYRFNSQYGGGKTHTLITLAAMALFPGAALGTEFSSIRVPEGVKVVAFGGEEANPVGGQEAPGTNHKIFSLTGTLAFHLGGPKELERFSTEDRILTSPGAAAYRGMMGDGPVLILVDELPIYVRKALSRGNHNITNLETILYDLIAAVTSTPKAALIITAPDPNSDAFQEETGAVLRIINDTQNIIGRSAHDMTPTSPNDLPSILRRRLFQSCDDETRQAVADTYRDLYARHYPNQAAEFADRLQHTYPFHPDLLDLINNRLAANQRFQKVRGTLRLLGRMIATNTGKNIGVLHPHHIDPRADYFTDELNSRLEQGAFTAAIQTDITGQEATVSKADTEMPRKVAVTSLLGSLAPLAERGLSPDQVTRAILSPDDRDPGIIRDGINWLKNRAIYIDIGEQDLKFSAEPNIRNEVNSKTAEYQRDAHGLRGSIEEGLLTHFAPSKNHSSLSVRIFPSVGDIPDTPDEVQLAIINPSYCNQQSHTLQNDLAALYHSTGSNAKDARRQNLNNVVLLVAKSNNWPRLEESIARQKAARFVKDRLGRSITKDQDDELNGIIERADTHITQEISTHWSELYYPSVSSYQIGGAPLSHLSITTGNANRNGQQSIIQSLSTAGKLSPNYQLDHEMVWNAMNQLKDTDNPTTVKDLQNIFATGPRHTMILDRAMLLRVLGNAITGGHLVIHTANGQLVTASQAPLLQDDCLVYLAGYEPKSPTPPIPPLPFDDDQTTSTDDTDAKSQNAGDTDAAGVRPDKFSDAGAVANNAVQQLDAFMAQHGYTMSDASEIRITGMGEPLLTYLAGLFNSEDAICAYISSGNKCEIAIEVPVAEYGIKKMLWQNFKSLSGDDGSSMITVTPGADDATDIHRKLHQLTNQTIDLTVQFT